MSTFDDLLFSPSQPLTRKDFMASAGVGIATTVLGSVLPGCSSPEVSGQVHHSDPLSPPAKIPTDVEKPIELEPIHSLADRDTGPTPTPLPPQQRIGYALVGLGHLTLNQLLPALMKSEKSRPVALVSGSSEKMAKVAAQYGIDPKNCFTYAEYEKLANVPECQAVYIVLPNSMHAEYTIRAAKMGKHVLCEKPMATSAADCRAMIEACKKAKVKLMVAYRMQYEKTAAYVRQQLEDKTFGKPRTLVMHNAQSIANPKHWRLVKELSGGGSLPDIGLYCLNTARYLLGEEPTEVFAYEYSEPGNDLFSQVEERVSWLMKFPSGVTATCVTDYATHESRHYRVLCEKGWLDVDNAFAYEGQVLQTRRADGPILRQEKVDVGVKDQFMLELDHFSDCIRHNKEPDTPGNEGLRDQIIMEAIYASAKSGKTVMIKSLA